MPISQSDHTYASRPEGDQLLTVHRDTTVPVTAVLLYFHGGGWRGGSRDVGNVATRLVPLTASGIVVVSADYRLTGDAVYPAQLADAGDALEWVAAEFPDAPLFVSGASAGGHLAALVGLGAWERLTGRPHRRPASGVVTYALVADPLQWDAERLQAPRPVPGTFAHWSYQRTGQWPPGGLGRALLAGADTAVSPVVHTHVDTGAAPFFIIHGDRDTCVSYTESVQLFDTLSSRDGTAYLLEIAGADHEDPAFDEPVVRGAIAAFIGQFSPAAGSAADSLTHDEPLTQEEAPAHV